MVTLRDKDSGAVIGEIQQEDLRFLIAQLEEETADDRDYYIDADTLAFLGERGGNPQVLHLLGKALGDREGMEIVWSEA
jgi:hypothetical protein